jgi:hypothetical protein
MADSDDDLTAYVRLTHTKTAGAGNEDVPQKELPKMHHQTLSSHHGARRLNANFARDFFDYLNANPEAAQQDVINFDGHKLRILPREEIRQWQPPSSSPGVRPLTPDFARDYIDQVVANPDAFQQKTGSQEPNMVEPDLPSELESPSVEEQPTPWRYRARNKLRRCTRQALSCVMGYRDDYYN